MGILMLVGICVRVCYSNADYRFMLVFPQSSEEDITSVSIVRWIINRRIVFCIRIVGLSRMLFWDWGEKGSSRTAAGLKAIVPNSISSLVTSSAWLIENSSPHPSHLRGRPSGDRE
jgi:hypothetical protein